MRKIVNKLPTELKPYGNNARTHSEEQIDQIVDSIREFGFTNPILIDDDGMIIAGHGRNMAALRMGLESVPCLILSELSEEQKRAYIIADNKIAMNAGWDMDLLKLELGELDDIGFDLSLTGFSEFEINMILDENEVKEPTIPDELPKDIYVQNGDVWQLGRHFLKCGDSTKEETYSFLPSGQPIDLYLTDPPYNVGYVGKTSEALTIQNDDMDDESYVSFLADAFANVTRKMKAGAPFYIFHADTFGLEVRQSAKLSELDVRQVLAWVKNSMVMGRQDYQWKHEPCLYGWKSGGAHAWYSDRTQTTVLNFDKPSASKLHPTMKPVALFDYLIRNSLKTGDIVFDNFVGSGTTIIACEQNGRIAYAIEKDPAYAQVVIERWEELTGLKAVKA